MYLYAQKRPLDCKYTRISVRESIGSVLWPELCEGTEVCRVARCVYLNSAGVMSDLDRYIETRARRDTEFADVVEREYENLRIGELIRHIR